MGTEVQRCSTFPIYIARVCYALPQQSHEWITTTLRFMLLVQVRCQFRDNRIYSDQELMFKCLPSKHGNIFLCLYRVTHGPCNIRTDQ